MKSWSYRKESKWFSTSIDRLHGRITSIETEITTLNTALSDTEQNFGGWSGVPRFLGFVMNFTQPVFLARANLVFVGIRYKHLGYMASKASPFYTTEPNSLRAAHPAAGTERSHSYPIPESFVFCQMNIVIRTLGTLISSGCFQLW